jgi:hypothetical protein
MFSLAGQWDCDTKHHVVVEKVTSTSNIKLVGVKLARKMYYKFSGNVVYQLKVKDISVVVISHIDIDPPTIEFKYWIINLQYLQKLMSS